MIKSNYVVDENKISNAIFKALATTSKADHALANQLENKVVQKLVEQRMIESNYVVNEKIIQFNFKNTSQFTLTQKNFVKSKGNDMQSTTKFLAYHYHNVLQRGDYHT